MFIAHKPLSEQEQEPEELDPQQEPEPPGQPEELEPQREPEPPEQPEELEGACSKCEPKRDPTRKSEHCYESEPVVHVEPLTFPKVPRLVWLVPHLECGLWSRARPTRRG